MVNKRTILTQEWLDERYAIATMEDARIADKAYYEGAREALQFLGYYVIFENGKHKIFK